MSIIYNTAFTAVLYVHVQVQMHYTSHYTVITLFDNFRQNLLRKPTKDTNY